MQCILCITLSGLKRDLRDGPEYRWRGYGQSTRFSVFLEVAIRECQPASDFVAKYHVRYSDDGAIVHGARVGGGKE
ncbi:hypothetical protein BC937DRAFT_86764 [Endogone sp. FLAS-F59071]|nr:hypothetical protein BC937DRAFT_86764 [Endogone sp. FLAS-F59071]|eukprot:RUS22807.1 hypothetical protein BC937DRAFT_86764 [Endogone sp. FLAS-F59071]